MDRRRPSRPIPIPIAPRRQNRHLHDFDRDDYSEHRKIPEPAVCSQCHAVFHKGRWQWSTPPQAGQPTQCPACARVQAKRPAGELTLFGAYLQRHQSDILQLVRNVEAREKAEHPLSRIIDIERREGDALQVTTTTSSLARALGDAVTHAHRGLLSYQYHDAELLRVKWQRFD